MLGEWMSDDREHARQATPPTPAANPGFSTTYTVVFSHQYEIFSPCFAFLRRSRSR
jgi:hypothetical protein